MTNTNRFTITETQFVDAKFYFKSSVIEELRSLPNHLRKKKLTLKAQKGISHLQMNEWLIQ